MPARRRRSRLVLAAIVSVIGIFCAATFAYGAWNPFAATYVQGVDVSRHQGPIDWNALARSDVRFAYIKATEGGDYVDPRFEVNWGGAGRAGFMSARIISSRCAAQARFRRRISSAPCRVWVARFRRLST
jgi:hypothetical protein